MSENVVIGVVSLVGFLCISTWFHVAFRFLCMYVPGQGLPDPPDFLFLFSLAFVLLVCLLKVLRLSETLTQHEMSGNDCGWLTFLLQGHASTQAMLAYY